MLILIPGITGSLGQRLAAVALSRGIQVRRNPSSLSTTISNGLESFITSTSYYDIAALEKAVSGVDAIINAYAPHPLLDLDGHLLLIRAAERAQIKIFIASSWSRDWTNINFGDFEHYDNHIAFEAQTAKTSSIRPVYLMTGIFADLLYTQYGPGGFDASGGKPRMKYWGNGDTDKHPWSTVEDVVEWTIDVLLYGDGVQAGKGGFFKIRSGDTNIKEMADVYEKVNKTKVEITREGSLEDLQAGLAKFRREGGPTKYGEWMAEAAAVIASKGNWEMKDSIVLPQFREPTTLEDWLTKSQSKRR